MSYEPIENRRLISVISFVIGIFQRENHRLTANELICGPVNREVNRG